MVGHFDCEHRCIIEKNVPIAFMLPSRWRDGAEGLGKRPLAFYGITKQIISKLALTTAIGFIK